MRSLSVRKPAEAVQKPVKPSGGIKVRTGLHAGGVDVQHSRKLLSQADRLLASADLQIKRFEAIIRRELDGRGE